uniref:Egg-white cystatin n=1 Tax=Taeniopygia guttata TaxID=59729 RepID=A0A674HGR3_TAEGU
MAADRVSVLVLLVAALLCFAGAVRGAGLRPRMVGAPQPIENPENDEGLERALQFAMTAYNRASNDMYSSRVVRVISAQRQIVAGVKYIMEVEIARTTCTKPATDIQHCAFHEEPQMAKHTICNFVVLNVPWRNQVELLESKCQGSASYRRCTGVEDKPVSYLSKRKAAPSICPVLYPIG